jgi:hypothetical protein
MKYLCPTVGYYHDIDLEGLKKIMKNLRIAGH